MPRLRPDELLIGVVRLLEAETTPPDIARRVGEILVNADLAGHPSHGVARLPGYLEDVAAGGIKPAVRPTVRRETAAVAVLDGQDGWGHYAADRAMALAIDKARQVGLGGVALLGKGHIGRLGEYVEAAARAGMIGLVMLGFGGRGMGWSAPLGGKEKRLMTNPIAIGVPVAGDHPFVLDFATTTASRGKIEVARQLGKSVPEGWILDSAGKTTTRPEEFFDGGFLTLMGEHKGYGLSLATCLLGGLGGAFNAEHARMGGVYMQALDIGGFQPSEKYLTNAQAFLSGMRGSRPVSPDRPPLVPGDVEAASRQATAAGVEVPDETWSALCALFQLHGVERPGTEA